MNNSNLGVALTKCYFCGENSDIMINTLLTPHMASRVESMHGKVASMNPCSKCEDYMSKGVILITIDDDKSDKDWNKPDGSKGWMPNPYRTGGFVVMTDDAIKRLVNNEGMQKWALKNRFMFIEHKAAVQIGIIEQAINQQGKESNETQST